jgi:four helix bundle protein
LALKIYEITKNFPKEEMFGIASQLRRAVVSITSNIAEGFSRESFKEKIYFYSMARGSLTEVQNQLLISRGVNYLKENDFVVIGEQTAVVHRLINALIKKSKSFI